MCKTSLLLHFFFKWVSNNRFFPPKNAEPIEEELFRSWAPLLVILNGWCQFLLQGDLQDAIFLLQRKRSGSKSENILR